MFARWRDSFKFNVITYIFILRLTIQIITVIHRLKTIQVIIFMFYFQFTALFA